MKKLTNTSEVCSFLGMTNQLSKFAPSLTKKAKPLRDLLSNAWVRGESMPFRRSSRSSALLQSYPFMIQTWTPLSQQMLSHSDLELFSCRNSQMQVEDPWCMHRDLLHQPSKAMLKLRKRHLLSPGPVESLQSTFWESHSTCTHTTNH